MPALRLNNIFNYELNNNDHYYKHYQIRRPTRMSQMTRLGIRTPLMERGLHLKSDSYEILHLTFHPLLTGVDNCMTHILVIFSQSTGMYFLINTTFLVNRDSFHYIGTTTSTFQTPTNKNSLMNASYRKYNQLMVL